MYIFYGDESGFSKGGDFEPEQPFFVFAGILIDLTKLNKALRVYDQMMEELNKNLNPKIKELKFSAIKQGQTPFKNKSVEERLMLLEEIIGKFYSEIKSNVFYSVVDAKKFIDEKKNKNPITKHLNHPYLAGAYRVISKIEHFQKSQKNNKGHTFIILDQQQNQDTFERLVTEPLHLSKFTQIIDTAYYGKSHYSRLIQIADLIAGIIRYYYYIQSKSNNNKFDEGVPPIFNAIHQNAIHKECFNPDDNIEAIYFDFYNKIEIK